MVFPYLHVVKITLAIPRKSPKVLVYPLYFHSIVSDLVEIFMDDTGAVGAFAEMMRNPLGSEIFFCVCGKKTIQTLSQRKSKKFK